MGKKISGKDLIKLGFSKDNSVNVALGYINRYHKKKKKEQILKDLKKVLDSPESFLNTREWGKIAEAIIKPVKKRKIELTGSVAPFKIYGNNGIDDATRYQFYEALKLPVSVQGALMPDAHVGYGLPVGGVLATHQAVIPYAVGVDIACRMRLSIFPVKASYIKGNEQKLVNILKTHTKFGMKEFHDIKGETEVFEDKLFREIPLLRSLKDKAYKQLGTSGGGNHFVEFGVVRIANYHNEWNLEPGNYLAVLSHSGSRSLGAQIARHYTDLAIKQTPLPDKVKHLAWLDMNSHDGTEYWLAMNLAGAYAKANHDDIHRRIAKALGEKPVVVVENFHNFAWKEQVNGVERIVHRKGATPAQKAVSGIIPGSMTSKGYIVKGLGNPESLSSASHGAGRLYSRRKMKQKFTQNEMKRLLKEAGVKLIGGSLEEAPMAYKNIDEVMMEQRELVEIVAVFQPKIVRMA